MDKIGKYRTETFPKNRLATTDIGQIGLKKHHMIALIELDVTEARRLIAEKRKVLHDISFNAWLIKCVSQVVTEFPEIHAVRKGKRQVVIFEDVDISIMIEREIGGKKVPLPYVLRKTNQKSIAEITQEIKGGQQQAIEGEGDFVLGEKKDDFMMKAYYWLPGFMRRWIWKVIVGSPNLTKQNMGTVMITSVGTAGRIRGWVIPVSVHPLCVAAGSIVKKPGVVHDQVEVREYLNLTILADHDVIDGAPAVRALSRLTRIIESGYGLT